MNNWYFKYLLSNNPNDVLSKKGIQIRRKINKSLQKVMKVSCLGTYQVIGENNINPKRKNIIAATHEFKDDIVFSMLAVNKPMYLLYGNIRSFLTTKEGLGLFLNGVILVDRKNKESRQASIAKGVKALELGSMTLEFPEATYNFDESKAVLPLFPGTYNKCILANKTNKQTKDNVLVTPVALVNENDNALVKIGKGYDPTIFTKVDYYEMTKNHLTNINKIEELFTYYYPKESKIIENIINLKTKIIDYLNVISKKNNLTHTTINDLFEVNIILFELLNLEVSQFAINLQDNTIKYDVVNIIFKYLKSSIREKSNQSSRILREKLATLKWSLYKEEQRKNVSYNIWQEYINKQKYLTNGMYDDKLETSCIYKEPLNVDYKDVYSKVKIK